MTPEAPAPANTQTLREGEETFRLIIENVQDYAIFMLDPKGYIATWNAGAERAKGYKAHEIIGKHFSVFYPKEDAEAGKPELELETAAREGRVEDEGWRVRKDGSRFWALVVVTALRDKEGQLKGFAKITRDITERRRTAEQLRRSYEALEEKVRERTEHLIEANRELEHFAYAASHDLQEPLRNIASYVDLLFRQYPALVDAKGKVLLEGIRADAARAREMLLDLLNFAKIGVDEKSLQPHDMEKILDQALSNLASMISSLPVIITRDPLPTLTVVPTQMIQVFQNLISNAVKYNKSDPIKVHVSAKQEYNHWIFSVRDNGIGIDSAYTDRIFQIFERLHARSEYGGSGIGLALCKKIVERHHGRIWAHSAPGVGSTFYFSIRAA